MRRSQIGFSIVFAILGLTFLSEPAGATGTNIVVNGGFETGDFTGWTESGDNPARCFPAVSVEDLGPTSFCPPSVNTMPPHSGQYAAFFNYAPSVGVGTISQTLSTTSGESYNLTFWVNTFTNPTTPNQLIVDWGGQQLFDLVNINTNNSYVEYSSNVVAMGSNTILEFIGTNTPSSTGLDDVSVVPTPEPSSLILLCFGVIMALGLTQRKTISNFHRV